MTMRPTSRIAMLEHFPRGGIVAELGVFRGMFSRRLLDILKPHRLYLVDLWSQSLDWVIDGEQRSINGDAAYRETVSQFENDDRVRIRRQSTIDFLVSTPDDSLDVVYLDADHSYESVRDELALAWPRLRTGGWLAGHDYCDLFPGVIRAVDEFCRLHGISLDMLTDESPCPVINCPDGPSEMAYNSFAIKRSP